MRADVFCCCFVLFCWLEAKVCMVNSALVWSAASEGSTGCHTGHSHISQGSLLLKGLMCQRTENGQGDVGRASEWHCEVQVCPRQPHMALNRLSIRVLPSCKYRQL